MEKCENFSMNGLNGLDGKCLLSFVLLIIMPLNFLLSAPIIYGMFYWLKKFVDFPLTKSNLFGNF